MEDWCGYDTAERAEFEMMMEKRVRWSETVEVVELHVLDAAAKLFRLARLQRLHDDEKDATRVTYSIAATDDIAEFAQLAREQIIAAVVANSAFYLGKDKLKEAEHLIIPSERSELYETVAMASSPASPASPASDLQLYDSTETFDSKSRDWSVKWPSTAEHLIIPWERSEDDETDALALQLHDSTEMFDSKSTIFDSKSTSWSVTSSTAVRRAQARLSLRFHQMLSKFSSRKSSLKADGSPERVAQSRVLPVDTFSFDDIRDGTLLIATARLQAEPRRLEAWQLQN